MKYLILYLIFINIWSFSVCGADKRKAVKGRRRVSERCLFIFAFLGGGIGLFLGMHAFHHKTRKKKFTLGVPAVIIAEYGLILWLILTEII